MDAANRQEAQREALLDIEQGADIVMVKPALPYLDVISDIAASVDVPVGAYNVSGAYAMITAADKQGWLDGQRAAKESLVAMKRAGADFICSYFTMDIVSKIDGNDTME